MILSLDALPPWKARAARLLARQVVKDGRTNLTRVARTVGRSRMSVHRLMVQLKSAHADLVC